LVLFFLFFVRLFLFCHWHLPDCLGQLFNLSISFSSQKRGQSSLVMDVRPCTNATNLTEAAAVIQALALDITPNLNSNSISGSARGG
jgi:hypothetical protein